MNANPLATDQAEALTRLAALAKKQGIHPDEFRTRLVYEFSGDLADQMHRYLDVMTKLRDDLSLVSPQRGAALAAASKPFLQELSALYDYLVHLKEHPLDWPAKQ
ncbi:hypothetical protein ICL81_06615 [Leucobacter sp. cx-328]|uniref:hypothetical protein n=1 Tax=unclassified Leucobacter TaxID=2621730 RepID=UPI00165D79AD|nr:MULTISPECIES: hypothetical protein [unclassified Leucobacter]MBC9944185.1 hypothetical protein [Leucobacter sp. cx-328]